MKFTDPVGKTFAAWVARDNLHIRQLMEIKRFHIEKITQPYTTLSMLGIGKTTTQSSYFSAV